MVVYDERGQSTSSAVLKPPMENGRFIKILQEIRQEIAEYGSICVEYDAKNRGDRGIELLIEDVLRQAKEQVLEIIDTHISALSGKDQE